MIFFKVFFSIAFRNSIHWTDGPSVWKLIKPFDLSAIIDKDKYYTRDLIRKNMNRNIANNNWSARSQSVFSPFSKASKK